MIFETEYQLQEFREIQEQYFTEDDKLWGGLHCANLSSIMEQMLKLINQMEIELIKRELADKYDNIGLDQAFKEMDKAKDDLFESIAIICKDYNKHKTPKI
jgi:hypothetical protein